VRLLDYITFLLKLDDFGHIVLRKSLKTLLPCCWLNDEVINYYYLMLSRRDEKSGGEETKSLFQKFLFDEAIG
jgi:Ulp1 family protease